MSKLNILVLYTLFVLSFSACDREKLDTKRYKKELDNRKLRHVNMANILDQALQSGAIITDTINHAIELNLISLIKQKGLDSAALYCSAQKYAITDTLSLAFGADIKRLDARILQQKSDPVAPFFDAYLYNAENNLAFEANAQNLKNEYWLYTKAIVLDKPVCASCHGEAGKDLSQEAFTKFDTKYPGRKLWGNKKGALLGMWAITMQQKMLIRQIN